MSKSKDGQTNKAERRVEMIHPANLIPYARNAKKHDEQQVAKIAGSIREFGFNNPVLIDQDNGIIAGHGRVMAALKLGLEEVPVIRLTHLSDIQRRAYILADNKLAELGGGWDEEMLKIELEAVKESDLDHLLTGFSEEEFATLFEGESSQSSSTTQKELGNLAERFGLAPFSVLNAREGQWQNRKRQWNALGIKSEIGRTACPSGSKMVSVYVDGIRQTGLVSESETSIFDPTLTELLVRWFSPKGGTILDPFAGGSVRGIVSGKLGRQYIGVELRDEQVQANREQANVIFKDAELIPVWHCGDSATIDKICHDVNADMVLGCPPYADLEVYSDDPRDISNKGYDEFLRLYREIIQKTVRLLKSDTFVAWVVGEVRDKRGYYYNFVGDTVQAFKDAGLSFYNEAILVTATSSLPLRVGRQFSASRKLGKTHQNVLVFVKGDGKNAAANCGDCSDSLVLDSDEIAEVDSDVL